MKKQIITAIFISSIFLAASVCPTFAAIESIPSQQSPINQRDKYQTDIFTGNSSYSQSIQVPKGSNNLTPDVTLSYSNAAINDSSTQTGIGWMLDRDYIQRDVNYTPWDTTDDKFKLHFKGNTYDLVYNPSDSLFHTKIESHLKIQQFLNGGQAASGMYWQVNTTDGALYRFGYASNSDLVCNGRNYDAYWNLDQVQDTHNNHIYYTYTQNNGVAYLNQIKYNNDQLREIDFSYGSNPYAKPVYIQGCSVNETSLLNNIQVKANGNLVHQYDLNFNQAADGQNLLNTITEKGSDGSSLPPTTFTYNSESTGNGGPTDYTHATNIDAALDHSDVQLCEMNGDGFPDLVKTGGNNGGVFTWTVKTNNGSYFGQNWTTMANLPVQLGATNMRLTDVTGDGKCDIVQTVQRGGANYDWFVWPNTSSNANLSFGGQQKWNDNVNFDQSSGLADPSLALIDMNGDGLADIVSTGQGNNWQVYLNRQGQNNWNQNNITWANGITSVHNTNTKIADVNGDGFPDVIESNSDGGPYETYNVYKNTGYSLITTPEKWINNTNIDAVNLSNHNVVIADVNGDGLPDIVRGTGFDSTNHNAHWQVLMNMGDHFSTTLQTWFDATMDGSADFNLVKLVDLNGDGQVDVLNQAFGAWDGFISNSSAPHALSDITTGQGGKVYFQYTPSSNFPVVTTGDLPFPLWVVQKMTTNNGLTGAQATNDITQYTYTNGLYQSQQREFRGFKDVTVTNPNNSKTVYSFFQDDALKGKPFSIQTNDSQNNPFTKTENIWSFPQSNSIYNDQLDQEKKYTYDGSSSNPKITETDYQYDTYGNVTKKSEKGDTNITTDDRFIYNEYTTKPTIWMVNKLSHTYVRDSDDTTKVSESWNYYDGDTGSLETADPALFGTKADGDLTVTGQTFTDTTRTPLNASANAGSTSITLGSANGFTTGKEILIIQMQGTGAGTYEFGQVTAVSGNSLTVQTTLKNSYTVDNTSHSNAQVLLVPQYQNVTVQNGGTLTAHAWDGNTGGIVAFRAQSLNILSGGTLTTSNLGFRANGVAPFLEPGVNAEGTGGPGNLNTRNNNGNGGGGGMSANQGGAGGGGNGTPGANGAGTTPGQGGSLTGTTDLTVMTLGGAGGSSDDTSSGGSGGDGGKGGGIIFVAAATLTVNSGASLTSSGANGAHSSNGNHGGSGGGAGGSILLQSQNATIGTNLVTATGGQSDSGIGSGAAGGNGGQGRIAILYGTLNGSSTPAAVAYQHTPSLAKGDLTKQVQWLSGGTNPQKTYQYDSYGNQTQVTDENNHNTTYTFGINDTTHTYPERSTNAKNQQTNSSYDLGTGNILSQTDPNGFITSYTYDAFGRITAEIKPYDNNTYPTTHYQYFDNAAAPQGTLISKQETSGAAGTLNAYSFVDGLGRKIQTRTDAQDPSQQIVTDTFYDSTGNISKETVPHLDTASTVYTTPLTGTRSTTTTYDPIGRPISITNPKGNTQTIAYDHWTVTNTDENNHSQKQYHNAYDKIIQIDELNAGQTYTTKYTYDPQDNLTQITDAENNNTNFTYNSLGRKTSQTDPDMGLWKYEYDGVGNLIKQTDNRNIITTRTYDEINRIKKVDYPTDADITYTYDGNSKIGTLTSVTDAGGTMAYSYDNRLRKTQEQRVMDGNTWTTQFTYDAADRLTTRTNPDGETITYAFNPQGEISSLTGILTNINYNAQNKITKKDFANGLSTNYTYNTDDFRLGRIQTASNAASPSALQDLNYTYDKVGNVASIQNNLTNKTQTFGYDDLDRLTTAQETNGYNYGYTYDPIGNLTQFTNAGTPITYTYGQGSGVHAVTSSSETATPTPTPTPTPTATLTPTPTPTPGSSTPALVQKNKGNAGGTGSVAASFTNNVTTGNFIAVMTDTSSGSNLDTTSVTDNQGNTYTQIGTTQHTSGGNNYIRIWYAKNVTGGPVTVTSHQSGSASGCVMEILEYSGVSTSSPADQSASTTGNNTSPSGGIITPTSNNSLILSAFADDNNDNVSISGTSGYTVEETELSNSTSNRNGIEDKVLATAGATTGVWTTGSSSSWAAVIVSFNPAGTQTPTATPTPTPTPTGSVNIAPNGTGYRWHQNTTSTSNANQVAASGINDGNITQDVPLNGGSDDILGAYEAAGVIWTSAQNNITQVEYTNGSWDIHNNGAFTANMKLQFSTDGTTWSDSGWPVTPAYPYDSTSVSGQVYTFTGNTSGIKGVRIVGQVHITDNSNSWAANTAEVKVFTNTAGPTPTPTPTATPTPTPSGNAYVGQYFSNTSLSGNPVLTRNDTAIDFDWSTGSPDPSVPSDNFSARWTKTSNFSAGTYDLYASADDGVRLYIDNNLVIDKWVNEPMTTYWTTQTLSAGNHTIKMEYYDSGSDAVAKFGYQQLTGTNISSSGTGYRWSQNTASASNSHKTAANGINDGNMNTDVALNGGSGVNDNTNAWEAAGITWSTTQNNLTRIEFINGAWEESGDGTFSTNMKLQFSTDGTTWTDATGWTLTPAYDYNSYLSAGKRYIFTGSKSGIKGARVVGQVHLGNDSWYTNVREVRVFTP